MYFVGMLNKALYFIVLGNKLKKEISSELLSFFFFFNLGSMFLPSSLPPFLSLLSLDQIFLECLLCIRKHSKQ